jgi:hypothetical protein
MSGAVSPIDQDLSLMELGLFAREEIGNYKRWVRKAKKYAFKATLAIFRAGKCLTLAHERLIDEGRGQWTAFLKENDLPRTTAWEAEELFKRAKTEDAVHQLTPTQAKRQFAVVKVKQIQTPSTAKRLSSVKKEAVAPQAVSPSAALIDPSQEYHPTGGPMIPRRPGEPPADEIEFPSLRNSRKKNENNTPASSAEMKAEPDSQPEQEPPLAEGHPMLTAIVQIVRRLELMIEDEMAKCDLSAEPKDAIRNEIARGIELFRTIEGGIS